MATFADRVASIGALGDPLRRELYLYVCARPHAVGRDEAADALGIAHHKAKFHLDRLESEGLLTAEFARLTGRSGPGAGRPAKLYRRATEDIQVSLPGREYELAGHLLATAVTTAARTGEPAVEALHREAAARGREWGLAGVGGNDEAAPLELARRVLADHGYEPRAEDRQVVLTSCPFHSLAVTHTELVCGMNLALVGSLVDAIEPDAVECRLEPAPGRCCVALAERSVSR
jgi:predicted ArsR family transcriptional regulator